MPDTLEPCGCFTAEGMETWPCSLHRGPSPADPVVPSPADNVEMLEEAMRMNGW